MATDHNTRMYFLLSPEVFMSLVEASPSGRFEMKIATRKAILIVPPAARVIPSAAFSGMLSIRDPMNNARPDVGLLSIVILASDAFACAFFDILGLDLLSRIAFAIAYEIPPNTNPIAVAGSV
jgi:hypothetical protein